MESFKFPQQSRRVSFNPPTCSLAVHVCAQYVHMRVYMCEIYENKLPEDERVVIETDAMKIWEYAMETDQGWYYVDDEGKIEEWGKNTTPWLYWKGKNIPWSDEKCKDIKAYSGLQLLILSEKDWEFLEKDSFYVKKYRKKYKGKYKYPVYLDNPQLQ